MLLNIIINLGNIWDALSAIGTVGAVIISLWITLPTKFVFGKVSLKGIKEPCYVRQLRGCTQVFNLHVLNQSAFEITVNSITFRNVNKKGAWLFATSPIGTELPHNVMPHECASIAYDLKLLQEIIKNGNFDNEGTYQFLIGTTFGKKFKTKKISGRDLLKIVKE